MSGSYEHGRYIPAEHEQYELRLVALLLPSL